MNSTLAVAHLDGKTTWRDAKKKGADACLFVGKIPVAGSLGEAVGFAFLVNGGKMQEEEAKSLLQQARSQYGTKLFVYLNLQDLEELVFSHTEGALGSFMVKAFQNALVETGLMGTFREMLRGTANPELKALMLSLGIR